MVGYVEDLANGPAAYAGGDPDAYLRLVAAANGATSDDDLLNDAELEKFMETLVPGDISPDQARRLIRIYGNGDVVSEKTIIEVMTTDGFLQANPGPTGGVTWSYNWDAIDGGLIADAMLRAVGKGPGDKLTAEEFDDASDSLFGDYEGLNRDNAIFLTRMWGTAGTLNREQIAGIFDRDNLHIDGVVTEDYIRIFTNTTTDNTPFADTGQAANYIMAFDGNGDGMINRDEFKAALESRMADGIELRDDLVDDYMAFYGFNDGGGQRVLDRNGVMAMLTDTSLYLAPRGPGGAQGFGINLNITPVERVVRGASLDDDMLNRDELARLFEKLGLGGRDPAQMDFLIKVYGNGAVVTVDTIMTAMQQDGFLTLSPNMAAPSTLNWDAIAGSRIARALFLEVGLNPDDPNSRMTPEQFNDAVDKLFGDWEDQSGDDAVAQVEYYGIGGKLTIGQLAGIYDTGGFHIDGVPGEDYVRSALDEGVIAKIATLPPPPITRAQIEKIHEVEQTKLLDILASAPDGSKEKILYNLLRLRAMAELPDYKGQIDVASVNADIQALMDDPEIQAKMAEAHEAAVVEVTGMSSADAALSLETYVKDPGTIRYYMSLPAEERQNFINDKLMEIATFDPARAKDLVKTLPGAIVQEMQNDPLSARSDVASATAVDTLFQTIVNGKRGSGGVVQGAVDGIAALTALQRQDAAKLYSDFLRSGQTDFDAYVATLPAPPDPAVTGALTTFHNYARAQGIIGVFAGAASVLALILDFTEGRWPKTAADRCNSAADILSFVGQGENFFKLFQAFRINPRTVAPQEQLVELMARSNGGAAGPLAVGADGTVAPVAGLPPDTAAPVADPEAAASEGGAIADTLHSVDWRDPDAVYTAIMNDPEARAYFTSASDGVLITDESGAILPEADMIEIKVRNFANRMSVIARDTEAAYGSYAPLQAELETVGTAANPLTQEEAAGLLDPPEPQPVDLADPAATAETLVAGGTEAEEAAVAAAVIGDGAAAGTEVAASSLFTLGRFFGALGVVGGIAGILYIPGQVKGYEAARDRGDSVGQGLQLGMLLNNSLASTAGIVGGIGAMVGAESLVFTAALPVAGVVFAVVGIGLFIANQIHTRHEHEKDVAAANALIDGGVGNGKEYRL